MLALFITLSFATGGLSSILCPRNFDPTVTVNIPHPTSCGKYLTCVGSSPVEMNCPGGLHWNEQRSQCDYPRVSRCSRGEIPEGRNFNATAVTTSQCSPQANRCPLNSKPTEHVVFLKHQDCRKFYACVSSQAIELTCPTSLYWNSRSCVCDYELEEECDNLSREDAKEQEEEHPEVPAEPEAHDPEPQPEPESEPKPEPEAAEPEPVPESNDAEPEPQPESNDAEPEPEPESDVVESEPEPQSESEPEVRARRSVASRESNTTSTPPASGAAIHAVSSFAVVILTITMSVL